MSDKAVSKWEDGKEKPQVDMLKKLSIVFGVQVEEMLDITIEAVEKQITKIVITVRLGSNKDISFGL